MLHALVSQRCWTILKFLVSQQEIFTDGFMSRICFKILQAQGEVRGGKDQLTIQFMVQSQACLRPKEGLLIIPEQHGKPRLPRHSKTRSPQEEMR